MSFENLAGVQGRYTAGPGLDQEVALAVDAGGGAFALTPADGPAPEPVPGGELAEG